MRLYDMKLLKPEPCARCGQIMPPNQFMVLREDGTKYCTKACAETLSLTVTV